MNKPYKILFMAFLCISSTLAIIFLLRRSIKNSTQIKKFTTSTIQKTPVTFSNPLMIRNMRNLSYPGSDISIEQILTDGDNYHQYLTSYKSEGLKIYALLTVPYGDRPKNGWPVILFNHGYIQPEIYQTVPQTGQYATYFPVFARNGYIVFKPDYRGNGNSDGKPQGAYFSPSYTIDDLNALASIEKYKDTDPNKIGVWGHSMGGNITLRDLVINSKDIKAAVIWGGVVGSYTDIFNWHDQNYHPPAENLALRYKYRSDIVQKYGTPEKNPAFWNSIDPTYFVSDISTLVQLDVGGNDEEVPVRFSESLRDKLQNAGKTVVFYKYPGANHNIAQSFDEAMQHSLDFFNSYVKGGDK